MTSSGQGRTGRVVTGDVSRRGAARPCSWSLQERRGGGEAPAGRSRQPLDARLFHAISYLSYSQPAVKWWGMSTRAVGFGSQEPAPEDDRPCPPSETCWPRPRPPSARSTPPPRRPTLEPSRRHRRPRRPRARRVRAGRPARRRPHPPRPPREPDRGPGARQRRADRRLLRRRHPLGLRGQDPATSWATPTSSRWPAGSTSGRTRAAPGRRPARSRPSSATATSATCSCPRWARRASRSCSTPRCCCSAPAASARPPPSTWPPPAWARSASSTWTWSTSPTSSARSSTTSTASASARSTRPRRRSPPSTPTSNVVTYDVRLGADNVLDVIDGYDVIVDGTDNFPTRYLVNDASLLKRIPVVHGSIFRFEGQATVFAPYEGPCYRCLIPEPPPRRAGPVVRRGRRARRAARHHRLDPGHGGHQAPPRPRRPAGRPAAGLRRPGGVVPHVQGAPRPRRARRAGPTPARSSSPSTTSSACPTWPRVGAAAH